VAELDNIVDGYSEPDLGDNIFHERQESEFYAQCVRDFLFRYGYELLSNKDIFELGVGTGETIVELLQHHNFEGKIRGYEIQQDSFQYARILVEGHRVSDRYVVLNEDFFTAISGSIIGGCAISNPPYLPAPDNLIRIPELWGGHDGSEVTKRIMSCGFEQLILLVSSFSNPLSVIDYASSQGYRVIDFAVRTMRFGRYSREPKVYQRIMELAEREEAFISADRYFLAGVAWMKKRTGRDLSASLRRSVTSLRE